MLPYGLILDDEDPAHGVLHAVRNELSLFVSLAGRAQPGADLDVTEIAPFLEIIVRRLQVAAELMNRAKRTRTAGAPLASDSTSKAEFGTASPEAPAVKARDFAAERSRLAARRRRAVEPAMEEAITAARG